jgi:hypothetical protein
LTNAENRLRRRTANVLATAWARDRIAVIVEAEPWDRYCARLAVGDFDLFLVSVRDDGTASALWDPKRGALGALLGGAAPIASGADHYAREAALRDWAEHEYPAVELTEHRMWMLAHSRVADSLDVAFAAVGCGPEHLAAAMAEEEVSP